ncbi:MAG: hypothetical protein M1831_003753 [Alyxoria varia]|nr:MAG: hypothetical protein M1831_003753 [Alyxoria varia]
MSPSPPSDLASKSVASAHLPDFKQIANRFRFRNGNATEPKKGVLNSLQGSAQSPLLTPSETALQLEEGNTPTAPQNLTKGNPAFHLIITAPEKNTPEVCRAIVSAAVLNYPPPTIIETKGGELDSSNGSEESFTGVRNFLQKGPALGDQDLVLVVDGISTIFQLPSSVFIHRYEAQLSAANEWSRHEYGVEDDTEGRDSADGIPRTRPRFQQEVFSAASSSCEVASSDESSSDSSPCNNIPSSPIKHKGKDSPPKYINPSMIVGSVPSVRRIFNAATAKTEIEKIGGRDNDADEPEENSAHGPISVLFSEQETERRNAVYASKSHRVGWDSFAADTGKKTVAQMRHEEEQKSRKKNPSKTKEGKKKVLSSTKAKGEHGKEPKKEGLGHEYGLGLDYQSSLFRTVDFGLDSTGSPTSFSASSENTLLNRTTLSLHTFQQQSPPDDSGVAEEPILPPDVSTARPPFQRAEATEDHSTLSFNKTLDFLPEGVSWEDLGLFTDLETGVVPAVIRVSSTSLNSTNDPATDRKTPSTSSNLAQSLYTSLWYAPHARALLRNYIRSSGGLGAHHSALVGGDGVWSTRGGKGGIWIGETGEWLAFEEVCRGFERTVFPDDGQGEWGMEEGPKTKCSLTGALISGDGDCQSREEKAKTERRRKERDERRRQKEEQKNKKGKGGG